MYELGIPKYTSYIFLGLSLSIGLLVYILVRDANRRKKAREEEERRHAERLLKELAAHQKEASADKEESESGETPDGS